MGATVVIIISDKNHQWILKLIGESWWETRYSHSLKVSTHKIFITKGVEKSDRQGLNQMIKVNMTSTGDRSVLGVSWYALKKTYYHLYQKMHSLNPIISKHQTNPNRRTFYKINGLYSSKILRSWETKVEELFWIKGDSETCLHNATSDSGLGY